MLLQNYKLLYVVNFEHALTIEMNNKSKNDKILLYKKMLLFTQLLQGNHSEIRLLDVKCFYFHFDSRHVAEQSKCSIQVFTEDTNECPLVKWNIEDDSNLP